MLSTLADGGLFEKDLWVIAQADHCTDIVVVAVVGADLLQVVEEIDAEETDVGEAYLCRWLVSRLMCEIDTTSLLEGEALAFVDCNAPGQRQGEL